jgi:hypothetical protein
MLDLSEITARAKEAPRQTADVEVIFDPGIAELLDVLRGEQDELTNELDQIGDDLQAELDLLGRDQRVSDGRPAAARKAAKKKSDEVRTRLDEVAAKIAETEARAADFLVTFRFTALHGFEWAELTNRSIPRDGVKEDARHGWNVDEITKIVAVRTGARVGPDGELIEVSAEEWAQVWETLPPFGLREIELRILVLNEYSGIAARNEAVIAARKVLTAQQARTPDSLSEPVSTRGDSQDGNQQSSPATSTTKTAA